MLLKDIAVRGTLRIALGVLGQQQPLGEEFLGGRTHRCNIGLACAEALR
jgi:hypothetical protein